MYIVFDIGGSKMRVAGSPDGTHLTKPQIVSTPEAYEDGVKQLFRLIAQCADGEEITAICGGIAGPFSKQSQTLVNSPHLAEWVGKPLQHELEHRYGVPVYLENDAALVALGEAVYGAGKPHEIVAYLTVSTGVGGARIVEHTIDERALGFEPGHQIIDVDGSAVGETTPGTLQAYVSGTGVARRYGVPAPEIPEDDPLWHDLARWLGAGVANTIVYWSPDVVVLGGAMIVGDPAISCNQVAEEVHRVLQIYGDRIPPVVSAELGHIGGLYGACVYIQHKHMA